LPWQSGIFCNHRNNNYSFPWVIIAGIACRTTMMGLACIGVGSSEWWQHWHVRGKLVLSEIAEDAAKTCAVEDLRG